MTDHTNPTNSMCSLVPHTTAEGLAHASEVFSGDDWDAEGAAAVHLPTGLAEQLLHDRGWTRTDPRRPWRAPTGQQFWDTDEALWTALVAEAFDPARDAQHTAVDAELRRDFINTILAHDVLLDEIDALVFEHVVEGRYQPHEVAATLRRLAVAAVTAVTPAYWGQVAAALIADVRDLEPEARHNPETDTPRSPER
jgi:hypothetical protein